MIQAIADTEPQLNGLSFIREGKFAAAAAAAAATAAATAMLMRAAAVIGIALFTAQGGAAAAQKPELNSSSGMTISVVGGDFVPESCPTVTASARSGLDQNGCENTCKRSSSIAAIASRVGSSYSQFCGGEHVSLSDELKSPFIITAAHCFKNFVGGQTGLWVDVSKFSLYAILGERDLSRDEGTEEALHINWAHLHPNFVTTSSDVALLEMEAPAERNEPRSVDSIRPPPPPGSEVFTAGWGLTTPNDPNSASLVQQFVVVPIVEDAVCSVAYGSNFVPSVEVCAGFEEGGKDACQGDSGGPLYWQAPAIGAGNADADEIPCETYYIGIVSWGIGCAKPGFYGVYVRVFAFQSWILSTLLARVSGGTPVAPCPDNEFTCGGGVVACVPRKWVCDGYLECENGADELPTLCNADLQNEQRACRTAGGLPSSAGDGFCDNINNNAACRYDAGDCCASTCNANAEVASPPYPFECGSLSQYTCIDPSAPDSSLHNGGDGEAPTCSVERAAECNACGGQMSLWPCLNLTSTVRDEGDSSFLGAGSSSFTGECVPISYLCDGVKDCATGSDELLSANYTSCLGTDLLEACNQTDSDTPALTAPARWLGDGECDAVFNCEAHNFDNGDCSSEIGCSPPEVAACYGSCALPVWIGDGICDIRLNCSAHSFDGGDCLRAGEGSGGESTCPAELLGCLPGLNRCESCHSSCGGFCQSIDPTFVPGACGPQNCKTCPEGHELLIQFADNTGRCQAIDYAERLKALTINEVDIGFSPQPDSGAGNPSLASTARESFIELFNTGKFSIDLRGVELISVTAAAAGGTPGANGGTAQPLVFGQGDEECALAAQSYRVSPGGYMTLRRGKPCSFTFALQSVDMIQVSKLIRETITQSVIPHLHVAWDAESSGDSSGSSGVFGRLPNGAGPFQPTSEASPGKSNEATLIDAPILVDGLVLLSAGSSSLELGFRMSQTGTLFYCASTAASAASQFAADKIVQGQCPESTHASGSAVVPELFVKINRTLLITHLRAAQTYTIVATTVGSNNAVQSKVYTVTAEMQACGNSEVMDCDGVCAKASIVQSWKGDTLCDNSGVPRLDCCEHNWDGGDCSAPSDANCNSNGDDDSSSDRGCGNGMVEDCAGRCFSADVIGTVPGGEFGGYWGDGFCNSELPGTPVARISVFDAYQNADSGCKDEVRSQYLTATVLLCNRTLTSCLEKTYPDVSPAADSKSPATPLSAPVDGKEINDSIPEVSDEALHIYTVALWAAYHYCSNKRPGIPVDVTCRAGFRACVAAIVNVTDSAKNITESDIFSDAIERAGVLLESSQQRVIEMITAPAPGYNSSTSVIFKPLEIERRDIGASVVPAIHLNCSRFFFDGGDCLLDGDESDDNSKSSDGEICAHIYACPDGVEGVLDCTFNTCLTPGQIEQWVGDGTCDDGRSYPNLFCKRFQFDGGDCGVLVPSEEVTVEDFLLETFTFGFSALPVASNPSPPLPAPPWENRLDDEESEAEESSDEGTKTQLLNMTWLLWLLLLHMLRAVLDLALQTDAVVVNRSRHGSM